MSCIRQVWNNDLDAAFEDISNIIQSYPFVSVAAVWGGFVARPIAYEEYAYLTMKTTVDFAKCLQIAFAFADSNGKVPISNHCFQFNFNFNERRDIVLEATLDSFKQNSFDTTKALTDGITFCDFGEALVKSGLLINSDIHWITFYGAYEFGYLLTAVTGRELPDCLNAFSEDLNVYFNNMYDIRQLLYLADEKLEVNKLRVTPEILGIDNITFINDPDFTKRSGYNAMIISICFFEVIKKYYNNTIPINGQNNKLYGIHFTPQMLLSKVTN